MIMKSVVLLRIYAMNKNSSFGLYVYFELKKQTKTLHVVAVFFAGN